MTERVLLGLATLAVSAWTLYALRRRSPLDPTVLFVGFTALVGAFYPLATAFVAPQTWRNVRYLSEEVLRSTQVQYLALALGVLVAAWASRDRRPRAAAAVPPTPAETWRDGWTAWGLLALGGSLYAVYVSKVGLGALLARDDFALKYRASEGLGPWLFGLNLVIVACLWAEGSALRQRGFFRLVALATVAWSIGFVAVRTYALALGIGYLYVLCRRRGLELRRLRPALVAAVALGYAGLESYSLVRGVWDGDFLDAVQRMQEMGGDTNVVLGRAVGGSELAHPFITAMELVEHEEPGALVGASYLRGLQILLPLALAPERQQSLAQTFAEEHYPDLHARGAGTAFSLVGEAWWNFGSVLGPFAVGLALAWFALWLARGADRRPHGWVARLLPYGCYLTLLLHRRAFESTVKHTLPVLVVVLFFVVTAQVLWAALARRPRARRSVGAASLGGALMAAGRD